jgi:hypothetical protein
MRALIIIALAIFLSACSKVDRLEAEYRQECRGDQTLKCRTMMIDLNVAKLEAGLKAMKEHKDEMVTCNGAEKYDDGIKLANEKISYVRDLKPGIFARIFLSDSEVEFNPPPFKYERELEEYLVSTKSCDKNSSRSTSVETQNKISAVVPSSSNSDRQESSVDKTSTANNSQNKPMEPVPAAGSDDGPAAPRQ